jgi:hypothetical protein
VKDLRLHVLGCLADEPAMSLSVPFLSVFGQQLSVLTKMVSERALNVINHLKTGLPPSFHLKL